MPFDHAFADDMWNAAAGQVQDAAASKAMTMAMYHTASMAATLHGATSPVDLENRIALLRPRFAAVAEQTGADLETLVGNHRRQATLTMQAAKQKSAPTHYVRYNEYGGVQDSQPADLVDSWVAGQGGDSGWRYERGDDGTVHATTPNGVHMQYRPYTAARQTARTAAADDSMAGHIQDYLDALNSQPDGSGRRYDARPGKRYTKIVQTRLGQDGEPLQYGEGVHAFVDHNNGLVYKPAGWSAPAKGPRFSLADPDSKAALLAAAAGEKGFTGGYLYRHGSASERVAAVRRALQEGQNPLAWIPQSNQGQGQAEKPSESGDQAYLEGDYVTTPGSGPDDTYLQALQAQGSVRSVGRFQVGDVVQKDGEPYTRTITRITPAGAAGTSRADGPTYHATIIREDGTPGHTADVWSKSMSNPTSAYRKVGRRHVRDAARDRSRVPSSSEVTRQEETRTAPNRPTKETADYRSVFPNGVPLRDEDLSDEQRAFLKSQRHMSSRGGYPKA